MWWDSENMFAGKEKFGEQNRGKEKFWFDFPFSKKYYLTCIIPAENSQKGTKNIGKNIRMWPNPLRVVEPSKKLKKKEKKRITRLK